MNKRLLASLLRSKDKGGILLAIFLLDWDLYALKDILGDQELNQKDGGPLYTCFGYRHGQLHICSQDLVTISLDVPKRRWPSTAQLFSWSK